MYTLKIITLVLIHTKQIACKTRVAVIGGGVSGLTSAYKLQNDHDVEVFEASSRLGGRMKTVIIDGKRYEAGGQAVGRNHKETQRLSRELNVELVKNVDCWDDCDFQYSSGDIIKNYDYDGFPNYPALDCIYEKRLNDKNPESNYLWENTVEKLLEDCGASRRLVDLAVTAIRANVGEEIDTVKAINLFESAYWGFAAGLDSWKQTIGIKSILIFLKLIDPDNLAFYTWKTYPRYDEEFMFKHGTIDLINTLASHLKPGSIKLDAKLTEIKTVKNKVFLTFSDKTTLEYDAVIVTIPISALRHIKFSTKLSKTMSNPLKKFIKTRSMASHAKLFLEFDHPWWNEITDGGFSFQSRDALTYSYWQADSEESGKHSLMVYVGGDQVKHLRTEKSADKFARQTVEQMSSSLGKRFGERFSDKLRKHYVRGVVTKIWIDDELFGGSYTAEAINDEMELGQTKTSIGRDKIHFAGEAWSGNFSGYIEGAVETGIKAANRVRATYNFNE